MYDYFSAGGRRFVNRIDDFLNREGLLGFAFEFVFAGNRIDPVMDTIGMGVPDRNSLGFDDIVFARGVRIPEYPGRKCLRAAFSAEQLYEQQWALNMLNQVLEHLQASYEDNGKGALFNALKPTIMAGGDAQRYVEIAEQLGMQESAIKVAAHRLRKQYRHQLRTHIAETVDSEDEVEAEIRQLFAAFSK